MTAIGGCFVPVGYSWEIARDKARASHHWHHRFQPRIDGDIRSNVATHRETREPDLLGIDLRLLFKKGDRPACGIGQQEPVSIPRTNHRINRVLVGQEITFHGSKRLRIELRSLAGIDIPPVRVLLDSLDHLAAAPVDVHRGITLFGKICAALPIRALSTTMRPYKCRRLLRALGKGIESRNPRVRAFESSNLEDDVAADHAVFSPLLNDLRFECVFASINVLP